MALRDLLVSFGFEVDHAALQKGEDHADHLLHRFKELGHTIAAVYAVHEIKEFFEATVHGATELARSAIMFGTTATELQGLQFAAEMSNVSVETLNMGVMRLQRSLFAAKGGAEGGGAAFKELGLSAKDLKAMSGPEEQISAIADGFTKIEDKSTRTGVAMKLFGRGGAQLLPFLMKGSAGIKELTQELEKLGGGFTEDFIEKAEKAHQAQVRLDMAFKSLRVSIVAGMMPAAMGLIQGLQWLAARTKEFNDRIGLARIALSGLIVFAISRIPTVIGMLTGMSAASALLLAKWLLLWLAVDDLIGLFTGQDSEIGAILDKMFGPGASEAFVADVKLMTESWQTFKDGVEIFLGTAGSELVNWFAVNIEKMGVMIKYGLKMANVLSRMNAAMSGESQSSYNARVTAGRDQGYADADASGQANTEANLASYRANFDRIRSNVADQAKAGNGGNWVNRQNPTAGFSMMQPPTQYITENDHGIINVNTLPATTDRQAHEVGRAVAKARSQQGDNRGTLAVLEHAVE